MIDRLLREALTQPYPWNEGPKDRWLKMYTFVSPVHRLKYFVEFVPSLRTNNTRPYELMFKIQDQSFYDYIQRHHISSDEMGWDYAMTKTGDEFRVMSTILAIIKNFVESYNPSVIVFSSEHEDKGRTKLYNRLIRSVEKYDSRYRGISRTYDDYTLYTIERK